jgi:hypothetical protein
MIGTEAPRRTSGRRLRDAAHPLVSLRSPLPLIVAGVGVTLLVIAVMTLPPRQAPEPVQTATLSDAEALTLVAQAMRSAQAAQRVMTDGQTRFDDGTWYVSVGGAHFHFTQRNRIVVAEDPPAIQLEFGAGP